MLSPSSSQMAAMIERSARSVINTAQRSNSTIATAESCTGGLLAGALTSIAGSSAVFGYGFVTYSNEAKQAELGVPAGTLMLHGAVSRETAIAMAEGALKASGADIALSITGIAGPDGGTAAKPVGLVHFACAVEGIPTTSRVRRFGNLGRQAVRLASVAEALDMLARGVEAHAGSAGRRVRG